MRIRVFESRKDAGAAAADLLAGLLTRADVKSVVVAGGNTPLPMYEDIRCRRLSLAHLNVFVLDEYVGVPADEPRTCTNLLREKVARAWGIPHGQFHGLDTSPVEALQAVLAQEQKLASAGGADVVVLGLGVNGHLGFNEPGTGPDGQAQVRDLDAGSTEGNRQWFNGRYAPSRGATIGLGTLLKARRVLVLAYGASKAQAVKDMVKGEVGPHCPASFLRDHPEAVLFLDRASAALLDPVDIALLQ